MGRRVLDCGGGLAGRAGQGFTMIEVLIAMAITIVVMLANLSLFNTANRNLAAARTLTEATNVATSALTGFRGMTIAQIEASAPTVQPSPNPLGVRRGTDTVTAGGTLFTRTWTVSRIDLEGDGTADLADDLVKVEVAVTWTRENRDHRVAMTTLTTGKAP